jgi:3-deoxy-D-manno-octulosonic-acid transferase
VLDALVDPRLADAYIIHAPRHIERVPELAQEVKARFGDVCLRSKSETGRYLLLDTYGELSRIYAIADAVIIGGGFDNLGGQNLIQPLAHGKPVLHGPHMQNFQEATDLARKAGAAITCETPGQLADALAVLLHDGQKRAEMGNAAKELVSLNLGASQRYAQAIVDAMRAAPMPRKARPKKQT